MDSFIIKLAVIVLILCCGVPRVVVGLYAGVDLGTSGCRLSIIEQESASVAPKEVFAGSILWNAKDGFKDAHAWEEAVYDLLHKASSNVSMNKVKSICISGTSATCLMVDEMGHKTREPRMYNYNVMDNDQGKEAAQQAMDMIDRHAPPLHTARAGTSSLAKLMAWCYESPPIQDEVLVHQADFVTMRLMMQEDGTRPPVISSDWHNCLKLGYDVQALEYPKWLVSCLADAGASSSTILPNRVVAPGDVLGTVSTSVAERFGLDPSTVLVGGTTDSNAAFFAAAPFATVGTAVTSLGSTLAIKQLSREYVQDASRGIYSHRFPATGGNDEEAWLVGGASNVGCAVLRSEGFSNEELDALSAEIDAATDSDLQYYPLVGKGERFPVADADKQPVLNPVPDSRREYLHGILQGISMVERDGFLALGDLGAGQPSVVLTCGGGSRNDMWTQMRQRILVEAFDNPKIKVSRAENTEASYGAATLAASSFTKPAKK